MYGYSHFVYISQLGKFKKKTPQIELPIIRVIRKVYYKGQRDLQEEEEEASSLQSHIIALLNIGKGNIGVFRPLIKSSKGE